MRKRSALWSLVILFVVFAAMIFLFAPLQLAFGLWGLALTELGLLGMALAAAALLRYDFRSVFPLARPSLRELSGVAVLWLGGFIVSMAVTCAILYLFPEGMAVGESLSELFVSLPLPLAWVIVALLPAVCEEALHRGVMLHTFSGFCSRWVVVLLMGLLFGLFHMDPVRFLTTTVLGMCLTYLMVERRNLILPILFHLMNNTVSVLSSSVPVDPEAASAMPLETVGIMLILSSAAIFLLRGGAALVQTPQRREEKSGRALLRGRLLSALLAVGLILLGSALVAVSGG